jgi:hypothetical protein
MCSPTEPAVQALHVTVTSWASLEVEIMALEFRIMIRLPIEAIAPTPSLQFSSAPHTCLRQDPCNVKQNAAHNVQL